MGSTTPSIETLKANDSGRSLVSAAGRHEAAARLLTDSDGNEYLVLRAWVGSRPAPNASRPPRPDAQWSEPGRWQHIVLDDNLDIVAVGTGKRERDSFEQIKRALRSKGITAGGGEGSRTKHYDPQFENVGSQTLLAWLAYWRNAARSQSEADETGQSREWHIGKLEAELRSRGQLAIGDERSGSGSDEELTPEQAEEALGIGQDGGTPTSS
jgi:hypothetical protein